VHDLKHETYHTAGHVIDFTVRGTSVSDSLKFRKPGFVDVKPIKVMNVFCGRHWDENTDLFTLYQEGKGREVERGEKM